VTLGFLFQSVTLRIIKPRVIAMADANPTAQYGLPGIIKCVHVIGYSCQ